MGRRVLVPMDFEPGSEQALAWAADLVGRVGGALDVLHVIPRHHQLDPFFRPGLAPGCTVEHIREEARARVEHLMRARKVRYRFHVVEGDPATRILEQVQRLKPDLVVVGTKARRGLARLFLGSVADRVIRAADAPVLTLRQRP